MKKNKSFLSKLGYVTAYALLLLSIIRLFGLSIVLAFQDIELKDVFITLIVTVLCIFRLGG